MFSLQCKGQRNAMRFGGEGHVRQVLCVHYETDVASESDWNHQAHAPMPWGYTRTCSTNMSLSVPNCMKSSSSAARSIDMRQSFDCAALKHEI
jgi:hypothetical protein